MGTLVPFVHVLSFLGNIIFSFFFFVFVFVCLFFTTFLIKFFLEAPHF